MASKSALKHASKTNDFEKKKKKKTNDLQKKVKHCRGGIGASTLSLCVHREGGERERGKSVRNPYLDKAELSEYFAL